MTKIELNTTIRFIFAVVLVLAAGASWLGSPADAFAQCGGTITIGRSVRGEISGNGGRCEYYFEGQAGDVVTISMTRVSGSLDPYLELYTPQGSLARSDDDSGGSYNSLISGFALPSTGQYTVVARAYGGYGSFDIGISSGMVIVRPIGIRPAMIPPVVTVRPVSMCGGSLQFGQNVVQPLPQGQRCRFTFAGVYSAVVNITMEKTDGSLDPYLELYDPSGRLVISDDDSAGNYNAWIGNYMLRSDGGTYTIVARSYGSNQTGRFKLTLWAQ